jgi:SAM-dependent methyltransferase
MSDYILWNTMWNETGLDSSWVINAPDENLVNYFKNNKPITVLEIGCGSGDNANFMSGQGCKVDAIDISNFAIQSARTLSANVNFICDDFMKTDTLNMQYDFIFDRGFFHGLTNKTLALSKIASLLKPNGKWLSLIGSLEGRTEENAGPPPHRLNDVVSVIEPHLRILSVDTITILNKKTILSPGWAVLSTVRSE